MARSRTRTRTTLRILLAVLAAGIAVLLAGQAWQAILAHSAATRLPLLRLYRAVIRQAHEGGSLYDVVVRDGADTFSFDLPPFGAMVLAPLGWFAALPTTQAWVALTLTLAPLAVTVLLTRRRPGPQTLLGRSPGKAGYLLAGSLMTALLLSSLPFSENLRLGGTAVLVVAAVLADASGVIPAAVRGVLTGLAVALRPEFLLVVVGLAVARQWRTVLLAGASAVAATGFAFLSYPAESVAFWTAFPQSVRSAAVGSHDNLSLLGLLQRWGIGGDQGVQVWLVLGTAVASLALWQSARLIRREEHLPAVLVLGTTATVLQPVAIAPQQVWIVLAGLWLLLIRRAVPLLAGGLVLIVFSRLLEPGVVAIAGWDGLAARLTWELTVIIPLLVSLMGVPPADSSTRSRRRT